MASQPEIAADRLRRYSGTGLSTFGAAIRWLWWFTKKKPMGAIGLFILTFAAIIAVFGPWLIPHDPLKINSKDLLHGPQWASGFVLGTDHLGRDNMSRLMIGARSSLSIAVIGVSSGTFVGFMLGLYSGFYPDWRDATIQRFVDMLMALPILVLALAIVAMLGASTRNVIIAISIIQVPGTARIVRSVVLSVRTMEYVQAARALGATDTRIIWRHVATQTFAPVMILVTASLGIAIIIEASLSFLGLGTPPPNPAWGSMLAGQARQHAEDAPWNAVFPGLCLAITVFGFNMLGDALRDVLDPRLRT